jgi:predicted glycoside hydrolase/deacetylase ChbG (UPF0249 family)
VRRRIRVIVNADDLGSFPQVDACVFSFMHANKVTSASLIANGGTFPDVIEKVRGMKDYSFGVHLNLTCFRPLTASSALEPLLLDNGEFSPDLGNVASIVQRRDVRIAVYREWRAQVATVIEAGIPVSHLDSHEHVHTIPFLFFALKRLQAEFKIRKVRISANEFRQTQSLCKRGMKSTWNFGLKYFYRTRTTQGFSSFEDFHHRAIRGQLRYSVYELMVHPGPQMYEEETELLRSDWELRIPYEVHKMNFHEL